MSFNSCSSRPAWKRWGSLEKLVFELVLKGMVAMPRRTECEWRGNFDHLRDGAPASPVILQVVRGNNIYPNRRSVRTVNAARIRVPHFAFQVSYLAWITKELEVECFGWEAQPSVSTAIFFTCSVFRVLPFLHVLHDHVSLGLTYVSD